MEPADRYKILCGAVAADTERHFELRAQRIRVCANVCQAVADFLGMPDGDVGVIELDPNFRPLGESKAIGSDVELQPGDGGLFYFGLHLHFESSASRFFGAVTLLVGVDVVGSTYLVKHLQTSTLTDLSYESLDHLPRRYLTT